MMKRFFPVFVGCLLLITATAHADVWGSQRLGDSIATSLATMLVFAYTVLFFIVTIVAALGRKGPGTKALIVYNSISLFLYLLFFIWLSAYFHSYPKSLGRILIEGPSEGSLHLGWMNIASFLAMLLSTKQLISGLRESG